MNVSTRADTLATIPGETMRCSIIGQGEVAPSMLLQTLLQKLHYDQSAHYYADVSECQPEMRHLFRVAQTAGVSGIYVFNARPTISQEGFSVCPAVYIAETEKRDQARQIHRNLWNLGYTPFLLLLLPQQIRVYTGFDYSETDAKKDC